MHAKIELFMLKGIGECMYVLHCIEYIMLAAEMIWLLLTLEVENISGVVRYCNKKVVG